MEITAGGVIAALNAFSALLHELGPVFAQGKDVLTSDDQAAIQAATADLRTKADAFHGHVQDRLRGIAA